ncbi:MAG: DUF255 domain-containing protein, partial [Candidatus Eisenbacteria bacterium]|nr:DUF255 domain-containing protein [Candidatus Latescibacterota bacterium]MBD3301636.1 DUF255 domain-containing protein [Candidatus Eisenbacteria bacterium]
MRIGRVAAVGFLVLAGLVVRPAVGEDRSGIAWMESFGDALERAALERKPVVVSFTAVWCGWCRKMERETYPADEIVRRADALIWVAVDGGKRPDLARRFEVSAYPTHVFLHP